jgi:hypothetical protein
LLDAKTETIRRPLAERAGSGTITDAQGLRRAYEQGDAYLHGKTLYVAGSHTAQDWKDDVLRIPPWRVFFGGPQAIHRYQEASKATASDSHPTNVLGGAVALQLQKEQPELKTRTYGAPVLDPLGLNPGDRYRSYGDPISMLDRGAKSSLDPPSISISGFHGYDATAGRHTSSGDATIAPSGEAIISE